MPDKRECNCSCWSCREGDHANPHCPGAWCSTPGADRFVYKPAADPTPAEPRTDATPVDDLRRLAEAAPPPPWHLVKASPLVNGVNNEVGSVVPAVWKATAEYIAACSPDVILALLDRLAVAESQREALVAAANYVVDTWADEDAHAHDDAVERLRRATFASPEEEKA